MPKKKEEKIERGDLQEAIAEIKQRFGEGAIMRLSEASKMHVEVISTGSPSIDLALGVGGVPRGRVIEIFGPESTGKTTLALQIIAQAQKKGGVAAFIDAEHALDPDYAKRIGVNLQELLISQPDSGEQALQILETLVRSSEVDVVVVDSVAALTPKTEIAGEMGEFQIGLQARLMSAALRKLSSIVSKTNTTLIFLNQIRMKIGVLYGNPETTPGGMALKFYASMRIELRRVAQIKSGDQIVGGRVRAKIVKNKVAPPFKTCEFDIFYNEGISYEADLVNAGLRGGILTRSGSWVQMGNLKLGQGQEGARKFLKENPKVGQEIREKLFVSGGQQA
ncbi:MAG: recombinase RecA [Candidatus Wildermuthbacteria bacterium RIFCSPHIGHO2_01_FULL_48_25]|uniref:Protein RecA n=1 Tax=Candidatus Wildermuthbacteria bacterium RIFCSPLOWO2_01_FULL_48_16 TaxID=1802461 RepID=A0A1G2RKL1_9BACT|nr:MAG: recombinase RecA [Candidatus Wildermuthbacteria bacterium RIFCSPHIGHO2_01_FULL_48_25]OHA68724.1 MAG: recombinase RecA [Candidatus Wildermuthbacteria bacterium RIFCSPHIGHO2_02_FULL_49_12b]OHA73366.1 MAG: recombinase RecA [Candidatus Wildermuthbacteria bacterium RIFCSPLOWO2_01_FULL_48_16]